MTLRIRNLKEAFKVAEKVARQSVMNMEYGHSALIRRYFYAAMLDSSNYNLFVNMEMCDSDMVVKAIKLAYNMRKWYKYSVGQSFLGIVWEKISQTNTGYF